MKTYIVLLKGINVGGHRKVPMAELRILLANIGFQEVTTYIQSGNVVLKSSEMDATTIESAIKAAILEHFQFEVSVMVKTPKALQRIFENSPFSETILPSSYFMLLHSLPTKDAVAEASEKHYENETYHIIDDCIYYYAEKGMGKAKFNANLFERKLNTFITARNYNTMRKLLSLSS